jgi:hypothetical protein
MCDVKVFLTFTFVVKILQVIRGCWWRWFTIGVPPSSLNLVLLWQLFYLLCSSIVINTVIETEYISTRSWYLNINFLRDRIRRIFWYIALCSKCNGVLQISHVLVQNEQFVLTFTIKLRLMYYCCMYMFDIHEHK